MKVKVSFSIFLAILAMSGGCSLLSKPHYKETAFYDLGAQKDVPHISSVPVEFLPFSDATGNGVRFLIRGVGGGVRLDAYNCFSAPPAQLIRRRLIELFPASFSDGSVKVSGSLNRLECDRERGSALMAIDYRLSCNKQKKAVRHRIETKALRFDGPGIAAAFEKAVIISAQRLAGDVSAFKKQCVFTMEKKK